MNKPAAFLLVAFVLAVNPCCEKQDYNETKIFNQSPHPGGHGHGSQHGSDTAGEHKAVH
jgi:hypothetical protein